MLRQSVMGSDMSYEDMMEDPKLENLYNATVVGEDTLLERPCWILELKAKPRRRTLRTTRARYGWTRSGFSR